MSFRSVRHPGLRLRLLAAAALVVIPALALLVSMNLDRRKDAERDITRDAAQLTRLATVDQERSIEGTRQLLIALSESRDIREKNIQGCGALLHQLIPRYGRTYNNIGFADLTGQVVCSGSEEPISIADQEYFTRGMEAKDFVAGVHAINRETGRASLTFAYPVRDDAGAFIGLVYATVDLNGVNEELARLDWPNEATVIVTDRRNTIIARRPDWQHWIGRSLAADPITTEIGERVNGTIDFRERNAWRLFAFEKISRPAGTGLTVRVFISETAAMAAVSSGLYTSLAALGLVALLVIAGAHIASDRFLIQPILRLAEASRRLAGGDGAARASSTTGIPELKELGENFDGMAAALEHREAARVRAEMERKELDQRYYQTRKMDAVGRLAGGVAHDFNNMLTAILGYCELLLEDTTLSPPHRADVQEIEKAGHTAAALTRKLLAFSRREIVEPIVVDLNVVIAGMDRILGGLVGDKTRMESRLEAGLDNVKADRGQLEQVVLSLIMNARDALTAGGRVLIETQNANMPDGVSSAYLSAPPGRYVMLAVSDEGSGISDEVMPHLFEPFFTTKGTGKGTGLGLATVYGIVRQNGGGICVQSAPDRGTVFKIYLPRTTEPRTVASAVVVAERAPSSKATILVVEDDPGIRELTSKVLARYGFVVLTADGGDEARIVSENYAGTIHVLLSDVVMPGMRGPKVAEMLSMLRPSIKVVYMSGYTDDAMLRLGAMGQDVPFLQKPFTPERLHNKILEVLGN